MGIRGMGYGRWVRVGVRVGMGCEMGMGEDESGVCLLYTSPSPRDLSTSRMPSSA